MELDPQRLALIAQEMDPAPFAAAADQMAAGGMTTQPAAPAAPNFSSVLNPQGAGMAGGIGNMAGFMNLMNQKPPAMPHAPAAAPKAGPAIKLPGMPSGMPTASPVPDLATILGRR